MSDLEKLQKAWNDWHQSDKVLRFGQYCVVYNIAPDVPGLFYERDSQKAYDIAFKALGL
jgi:hypothetical protein